MKPNFALSLSFEGIRLLHRAAGGWRIVGEVALDAPDMGAELAMLRRTATALEPGGLRTKLLLPKEQIKYLTIDTTDLDEPARRDAARAALDGATPYAVDDLAFDISADGSSTHVAAVARETLTEAEAFAVEHRFYPISFATIPGNNAYLGEPFFGPTRSAATLLAPGEAVEPDGIAVVVVGDVDISAETGPMAPALETAEPSEASGALSETPDAGDDAPSPGPDPEEVAPPEDGGDEAAPVVAEEESPVAAEIEAPVAAEIVEVTDDYAPAVEAEFKAPIETHVEPLEPIVAPRPVMPSPGVAIRDVPPVSAAPAITAPAAIPPAGFASRRGPEPVVEIRPEPLIAAPSLPDEYGGGTADVSSGSLPPAAPESLAPDSRSLSREPETPSTGVSMGGFLSRRKGKTAKRAAAIAVTATVPVPQNETERMTIFGARGNIGGKPRFLGLILTAALLVFLAGVAAWASVFLDDGLSLSRLLGDRAPRTAVTEPDKQPAPAAVPVVADVKTASLSASITEEDTAVLDALRDPVIAEVVEPGVDEQEASYATNGIWPVAPTVPPEPSRMINIDDLYLTSIDPVSTANDAVALPALASFATDLPLGNVSTPAAAGTVFALDGRGLVIPTPEGALSPDGFTVILGRPEFVPPSTPARFQAVPQDDPARLALSAVRPQNRPGDLAEKNERANLDGLTRNELAGYRPRFRPKSIQQEAQAAAVAAVAAAAAATAPTVDTTEAIETALATAEVSEGGPDAYANATRFAIKASVRPDTRPRNFARIVKRAQRTPQPEEETRVASAGTVAPRVVTPKIPSKNSVAKQATVKNAINLRQVNLIGVYGKPSSRRALVRLSNGRYKKVVVGDRIDGGKVSAIGDSELRYVKRGRNVVLKMPQG